MTVWIGLKLSVKWTDRMMDGIAVLGRNGVNTRRQRRVEGIETFATKLTRMRS